MSLQLSLLDKSYLEHQNTYQILPLPDAEVVMYESFFSAKESDSLFSELLEAIQWEQETTTLYGRQVALPRLTAWFGDPGKTYTYSKIKMAPQPWIPVLHVIKHRLEEVAGRQFNSVLLNLYRDGKDSIAWHSDDEKELGINPVIASVSFGDTRRFMFRHKTKKDLKFSTDLAHGDLLLMKGTTQHFWQHQVPKTSRLVLPRINLTFRQIG